MSSWLITCKNRKKIVIVGDTMTGKSSLVSRFLTGEYVKRFMINPTVVNDYLTEMDIDGVKVALAIWDTGGTTENDPMRPYIYPSTDMFVICYAIDHPESLHNVQERWVPEVTEHCPETPYVLVATKMDKKLHSDKKKGIRNWKRGHVEHGLEGKLMSEKIQAAAYFECSAKADEGVKSLFTKCTKMCLKTKREDNGCKRREVHCGMQ